MYKMYKFGSLARCRGGYLVSICWSGVGGIKLLAAGIGDGRIPFEGFFVDAAESSDDATNKNISRMTVTHLHDRYIKVLAQC